MKTAKLLSLSLCLCAALFAAACGSAATPVPTQETPQAPRATKVPTPVPSPTTAAPAPTPTRQPPVSTPTLAPQSQSVSSIQEANTDFGFRLFRQLVDQESDKNIFVSPLSVSMALMMTYNGAEGETREAMARALSFGDLPLSEINDANLALMNQLSRTSPKIELAIANSLWAREDITFQADFLDRNRQFYEAETTSLDFADPGAPDVINQWVAENTRDKIDSIIDDIDPDVVLFLINAIYFNGQWTVEFDKDKTQDRAFHLPDGSEKQHPMMAQSGEYQYLENDDFQSVSLPYGEGEMSMYVFLPRQDASLSKILDGLDAPTWNSWLSEFKSRKGDIVLPKFKAEYEKTLNDTLKALGMGIAFDPAQADFGGMHDAGDNLYISEVKHKAIIEVNEVGTEAAAVTSVGIGATSAQPEEPPPFSFVADHPFFYAIRDNRTGSIVFMGVLVDPAE